MFRLQALLLANPNANKLQDAIFGLGDPGYKNASWMKTGQGAKKYHGRVTSGPKTCGTSPPRLTLDNSSGVNARFWDTFLIAWKISDFD